ncbi:MAG: helix-turn-helix domain-containing protein [Coriobacteriia bacterium]|nr:helix-turn-helix domain-containing protein [Coriobacteriia bacterium]MCL2749574.1 helix-turn-helix domain-containing protein [Coriobacteriia bacterium]
MPDDKEIIRKLREHKNEMPPVRVINASDIGRYLKQTRKDIGLTQEELALISGVGLSFIHDLEHGKKTIQFDSLMKVVSRLDCKLEIGAKGGFNRD